MSQHERSLRYLAFCLAILAGFVDACGFLQLGGMFVSFVSGNSTRMGVSSAKLSDAAMAPASLIGAFVAGVMLSALLSLFTGARRRTVVLLTVSFLLSAAPFLHRLDLDRFAGFAMAASMGGANTLFQEKDGQFNAGVTYMTGNLVKFGLGLVETLSGRPRSWLPFLLLWLGMIGGAVGGATAYRAMGIDSVWIAASAVAVLAALAWNMPASTEPARK